MFDKAKCKEKDKKKLILNPISAAEAKEKSAYNLEIYRKNVIEDIKGRVWECIYETVAHGDTACYCRDVSPIYDTLSEVITYFKQFGYNIQYIPRIDSLSIRWG